MANSKLTDTQLVILSAAGGRDSRLVLPLRKSIRVNRGSQTIILRALLSKGLIADRPALPDEEVWESREDGTRSTLVITDPGLEAVGLPPAGGAAEAAATAGPDAKGKKTGKAASAKRGPASQKTGATPSAEPAKDTKLGMLIAALRRKKGATIDDLMDATGWQAHSVRGAISGALKKKLKLEVTSDAVGGRGRVYRIGGQTG